MSNEIKVAGNNLADKNIYVLISKPNGQFWDSTNSVFEDYSTASRDDYDIAVTEQGTSSGIYYVDFPSAITTAGTYTYYAYLRVGASPAETDPLVTFGKVDWTGTTVVSGVTGSMTGSEFRDYVLRGGFKRTDKDSELYEATTDAIQELRRRYQFDEAQVDMELTDFVSTLGDFKLSLETDFGMLLSMTLEDDDTAIPLKIIPKWKFDKIYPDINVTADRGYPEHATLYDGQIYIGPIPDSIDYRYRMSYSQQAGTIASSTTTVPFTNVYREILRDLVLSKLWEIMDQFDKAQYYKQKAEEGYLTATRRENLNQGNTVFNVTPFGM